VKLVAVVRAPAQPEDAARALADAGGMTLAEARMRLAPEPPSLLARLEPSAADALAATLRKAGLAALAVDLGVPTDRDRTVARTVALGEAGATFTPRAGEPLEVGWPEVLAVLRGARASRSDVERTETTKKLSLGRAVATGGLALSRTTRQTVRSSEESQEQVILVYARGGRSALLAERELDFTCLGPRMQPSSTGNMLALASALRDRARAAFHDDRLLRLGRRSLPLLAGRESRIETKAIVETRVDTAGSLDVLAEILRRAVAQGLLP
jgi:hypothetical protein